MTMRGALAAVAALLVAGCGFFGGGKSTYYSLEPLPGTRAAVTGSPIGINALELPAGLDRREVSVRQSDHRLDVRGNQLWAESLETMVLHALAFNLASRLPEGMVVLPGQAKPDGPMRSIDVIFGELAASSDQVFVLDARCVVHEAGRADRTIHERVELRMESDESSEVVETMNEALAALADRIVARL